jgi:hypothetical protein
MQRKTNALITFFMRLSPSRKVVALVTSNFPARGKALAGGSKSAQEKEIGRTAARRGAEEVPKKDKEAVS